MNRPGEAGEEDEDPNPWISLAALVFVALLIALSVWVANALYEHGRMQDCLMAGRTNCDPIHR